MGAVGVVVVGRRREEEEEEEALGLGLGRREGGEREGTKTVMRYSVFRRVNPAFHVDPVDYCLTTGQRKVDASTSLMSSS